MYRSQCCPATFPRYSAGSRTGEGHDPCIAVNVVQQHSHGTQQEVGPGEGHDPCDAVSPAQQQHSNATQQEVGPGEGILTVEHAKQLRCRMCDETGQVNLTGMCRSCGCVVVDLSNQVVMRVQDGMQFSQKSKTQIKIAKL